MANAINSSESIALRQLLSGFLRSKAQRRAPLLTALKRLRRRNFHSVIFGGVLRDLMVHGPRALPRDVDVVVDGASTDTLSQLFGDFAQRRNRFGGLSVNARGWAIDVWPLSETWAFRTSLVGGRDFEALTRTTFLNVEAVTVDLTIKPGRLRDVYSSGFFEAVRMRTLDINLEENPFPELATVRALVAASSLRYSISRRLGQYLLHHLRETPLECLVDVQLCHYGRVKRDVDALYGFRQAIREQLAVGLDVQLPVNDPVQLPLFARPPQSLAA